MGGSGGSWSNVNPKEAEQYLKDSKDKTLVDNFEAKVNLLFNDYLKQANDRNPAILKQKLDKVKSLLDKDIDGFVDLNFGGSVQKHTYVDGLSDIDCLVILNKSELKSESPDEVKDYILSKLKDKLTDVSKIKKGDIAVTVKLNDGTEIQLLPAIKTDTGIKIQDAGTNQWSSVVYPKKFADKLSKVNQQLSGKVIPTIKLVKAINDQLPEQNKLTGYHIESLAIKAFRDYKGPETTKAMVVEFFKAAKDFIRSPIKDSSEQEIHVDDYLGKKDSEHRKRISYQLDLIHRKLNNAEATCSVKAWEDIFGDL